MKIRRRSSKEFERIDSDDTNSSNHTSPSKKRGKKKRNSNQSLHENLIVNDQDIGGINDNDDDKTLETTVLSSDSIGLATDDHDHNGDNVEMVRPQPLETQLNRNDVGSVSQRSIHGQTRTSHAFWNLCKCYVGAASFALPWAVSKTGIIAGICGFLLLSGLAWLTFRWMLISSHFAMNNYNPTYPELAECAFSNFFPLFNKTQKQRQRQQGQVNENEKENDNEFIPMQEHRNNDNDDERERMINIASDMNTEKELYETLNQRKYIKYNYRCGKIGKILVYLCMFLGMIGACGSYILFISGVIQNWLSPYIDSESSLSFYLSIIILLPFPTCLSLLRSYSFLSSTAKFGVAGVVLALLVTIYDGCLHIHDGTITQQILNDNLLYFDFSGFPIFVGNACFLFIIHAMILSQEQSMIDRSRRSVSSQFKKANNLSLFLVTIINMIFAIFAYVSFVDIVPFPDNIVDGLDTGIIQQITRFCLCIDLLFTYALIMYPFTEALDTELFDVTQLNERGVMMKGNILRIIIVIITALIAIGIPHFGYLTGLTGGSASIFLGFILPPIFIWRLAPHKINTFELYILCPIIFIFGCIMFIWSPYLILTQMYA